MKFHLLFFVFIFFCFRTFAQTSNNISVQYGISNATVDIHGAIGDFGYDSQSGMNFGILYTRDLSRHFALKTGVSFINDKVKLNYIVGGQGEKTAIGNVKLISIPVLARFSFLKYLFADGGFSLDEQTNFVDNSVVDKQSGLGFELGIGGKYSFNHFTIFLNPYLHSYVINRFDKNLFESGVKVGLGYNF